MKDWKNRLKQYWQKGSSLRETFIALVASSDDGAGYDLLHDAVLSRVKWLIQEPDGSIPEGKWSIFRDMLSGVRSEMELHEEHRKLLLLIPRSEETDAAPLLRLNREQREHILRFLLDLAVMSDAEPPRMKKLEDFAGELEFSEENFSQLEQEASAAKSARSANVLRSSAGILVAVMVLVIFILTATLLRSLVFGLILAYLLLPLEKFFERRFLRHSGIAYWLPCILRLPVVPLRQLSRLVMRRNADDGVPEDSESRYRKQSIRQATGITVLLFLLVVGFLLGAAISLTGNYVKRFEHKPVPAAEPQLAISQSGPWDAEPARPEKKLSVISAQVQVFLDQQRFRFANKPVIRTALEQVDKVLHDETVQKEFIRDLLKRSGGLFSFTAGLLGQAGALLADLLLTFFFTVFFLQKMAEYCRNDKSTGTISSYLVSIVFNGKWLPTPSPEALQEGKRIIGGVLNRLQVWVKGYLTLVCIDSSVYCTVFYFLNVPYFPVLGVLAGCGILLPYIGPILSCCITCIVTLAVGDSTGVQLCGILISYMIYNGIVEQFLLYPAVIGEALGLTTLETIVFVLLGAIFAGIPGMLFALPAASVIKFLVPQIYGTIGKRA